MKNYYVQFKEKRSINAEARFEVDSFTDDFLDIYDQFQILNWEPFTMPLDPYIPELVWEFYASYREQQYILKHKDRIDMMPYLSSVLVRGQEVHITLDEINSSYWADPVRLSQDFKKKLVDKDDQFDWATEIIVTHKCGGDITEQFKRKDKKKATSMPYPILISLPCLHANCPLFKPVDKTVKAEG
ncbi:hypothetical protein HAX54_034975, partial [Datura stramonium]|nr:hypothetical protein [Datura stramonium]